MNMDITEKDIEENIEEPLGDDDIRKYLPDAQIFKYSRLENFRTIDEILPGKINYCVLLYEESVNKGHWVCLTKYGDTVEFFDSYGGAPDTQLKWNHPEVNHRLDQKPYLTEIFNRSKYNIVYNPIKYQDENDDINTCGRHCVFRILNLIQKKRDLSKYYKLMKMLKKKTGATYDEIVAFFISDD